MMTYALKSCLLMKTALIPVSTAIIFRNSNPYKNEKSVEFSKIDGRLILVTLSNHRAQMNWGFCFRSYRNTNKLFRFDYINLDYGRLHIYDGKLQNNNNNNLYLDALKR